MQEIFTAYGDPDIYRNLGLFGILGRGLYDNSPLKGLIARYLTDAMIEDIAWEYRSRRLLIQTTNIDAQGLSSGIYPRLRRVAAPNARK